ncbi:MAG TPA: hypothetical protein VF230_09715 [Acidimicrobiales bacterium]
MTPNADERTAAAADEEVERVRRTRDAWHGAWDEELPLRKLMHRLQDPDFVDAIASPPEMAAEPVRVNLDLATRPERLANPLAELQGLEFMARMIERSKVEIVAECRRRGRSWAHIGDALGVARQSAWMKYGASEAD